MSQDDANERRQARYVARVDRLLALCDEADECGSARIGLRVAYKGQTSKRVRVLPGVMGDVVGVSRGMDSLLVSVDAKDLRKVVERAEMFGAE